MAGWEYFSYRISSREFQLLKFQAKNFVERIAFRALFGSFSDQLSSIEGDWNTTVGWLEYDHIIAYYSLQSTHNQLNLLKWKNMRLNKTVFTLISMHRVAAVYENGTPLHFTYCTPYSLYYSIATAVGMVSFKLFSMFLTCFINWKFICSIDHTRAAICRSYTRLI